MATFLSKPANGGPGSGLELARGLIAIKGFLGLCQKWRNSNNRDCISRALLAHLPGVLAMLLLPERHVSEVVQVTAVLQELEVLLVTDGGRRGS